MQNPSHLELTLGFNTPLTVTPVFIFVAENPVMATAGSRNTSYKTFQVSTERTSRQTITMGKQNNNNSESQLLPVVVTQC
jgi:hypothetical protein